MIFVPVLLSPYFLLAMSLLWISWVVALKPYNFYCKVGAIARAHPELGIAMPPSFVPLYGDNLRLKRTMDKDRPYALLEHEDPEPVRMTLIFLGVKPLLYLSDADLIKTVLEAPTGARFKRLPVAQIVFDWVVPYSIAAAGGQRWSRQREIISPIFDHRMMKEYAITIQRLTQTTLEQLNSSVEIDFSAFFMTMALDVVATCACGEEKGGAVQRLSQVMCDINHRMIEYTLNPLRMIPGTSWIPTGDRSRLRAAAKEAQTIADEIVLNRIEGRSKPGINMDHDFLDTLLSFRYEDTKEKLPLEQIRDELVLMLAAGHETTGIFYSWMMVVFAQYPAVEARCRSEVLSVLDGAERSPTEADVKKMHYLRATIMETLRLYPPVPWVFRSTNEPFDLGGGHTIEATIGIVVQVRAVQRNPRYWPDPLQFDPGRFLVVDETTGQQQVQLSDRLHSCAWIPFSYGSRACPGRHFFMLEAALAMGAILARFDFRFSPGQKFPELTTMLSSPKYGVFGRLIPRASAS